MRVEGNQILAKSLHNTQIYFRTKQHIAQPVVVSVLAALPLGGLLADASWYGRTGRTFAQYILKPTNLSAGTGQIIAVSFHHPSA